jgi:hypothetical protein
LPISKLQAEAVPGLLATMEIWPYIVGDGDR